MRQFLPGIVVFCLLLLLSFFPNALALAADPPSISVDRQYVQTGDKVYITIKNLLPNTVYKLTNNSGNGASEYHIFNKKIVNGAVQDTFKTPTTCSDSISLDDAGIQQVYPFGTGTKEEASKWCDWNNKDRTLTYYVNINTSGFDCDTTKTEPEEACSLRLKDQNGAELAFATYTPMSTKPTLTPNSFQLNQQDAALTIQGCPSASTHWIIGPYQGDKIPDEQLINDAFINRTAAKLLEKNATYSLTDFTDEAGPINLQFLCGVFKDGDFITQTYGDQQITIIDPNNPDASQQSEEPEEVEINPFYHYGEVVDITLRNLKSGTCYYYLILDQSGKSILYDDDPAIVSDPTNNPAVEPPTRECEGKDDAIDKKNVYEYSTQWAPEATLHIPKTPENLNNRLRPSVRGHCNPELGDEEKAQSICLAPGRYKFALFKAEEGGLLNRMGHWFFRGETGAVIGGGIGLVVPGANLVTVPLGAAIGYKLFQSNDPDKDREKLYTEFCVEICTNNNLDIANYLNVHAPCTSGKVKLDGRDDLVEISTIKDNPEELKKVKYVAECRSLQTAIGEIDTSSSGFVGAILRVILSISGGIAIIIIMRAGYTMLISRGNPEDIQRAREMITSAIVGLLFILFAMTILQIVGVDILQIPSLGSAQ